MSVGYLEGQEKVLGPLELESYLLLSCMLWVLGTELMSSGRTSTLPEPLSSTFKGSSYSVFSFVLCIPP